MRHGILRRFLRTADYERELREIDRRLPDPGEVDQVRRESEDGQRRLRLVEARLRVLGRN